MELQQFGPKQTDTGRFQSQQVMHKCCILIVELHEDPFSEEDCNLDTDYDSKQINNQTGNCKICGKFFKSQLQRHIKTVHEKKKPLKCFVESCETIDETRTCYICSKFFKLRADLKRHIFSCTDKICLLRSALNLKNLLQM